MVGTRWSDSRPGRSKITESHDAAATESAYLSRQRPRKSTENEEATDVAPESDVAERKEALDDDIDAILDEIDDVLETNAEDFVKSFIQKGGE